MFIAFLNFTSPLQTKCVSSNDEPCIIRHNHINSNPDELKYDPFMIILGKFNGSCNVLSPKIRVPKEITKHKYKYKVFNMSI